MKLFLITWIFMSFGTEVFARDLGTASFLAKGEGLALDIEGEGGKVTGEVERKAGRITGGKFSVSLKDFVTGMALRDKHLCEAMECDQYPTADFTLTSFEPSSGVVKGKLKLHGKVQDVVWKAEASGQKLVIEGVVKLTSFGITPPTYKVAKVNDNVEVKIEVTP